MTPSYYYKYFLISTSISSLTDVGPNLPTTLPSLSTKNLVKFHLISSGFTHVVLILAIAPIAILFFNPTGALSSLAFSFKNLNNGSALSPLTSILENLGNVVLYVNVQNS